MSKSKYLLPISSKGPTFELNNIGKKALNLCKLFNNNILIPESYLVTTKFFALYKKSGIIEKKLVHEIQSVKKELGGKIAIRSSATCEDGDEISMAGVFKTVYLEEKAEDITKSVKEIFDHALSSEVKNFFKIHNLSHKKLEMGLIIQPLIYPDIAGTIYSEMNNKKHMLIEYTSNFGNLLADGKIDGSVLIINKSSKKIEKSRNYSNLKIHSNHIKTLIEQEKIIREIFSNKPQDIEFAIRNNKVYILQARTLTTNINTINLKIDSEDCIKVIKENIRKIIKTEKKELGLKKVILSNSNFSEILPNPQQMDIGIFQYIFTGINNRPGGIQIGRRKIGYPIKNESVGYLHYLGGKPYFSIAKDSLTYYQGIPEHISDYKNKFTKHYLELIETNNELGKYPEMQLYKQEFDSEEIKSLSGNKYKKFLNIYNTFLSKIEAKTASFEHEYYSLKLPETNLFIEVKAKTDIDSLNNSMLCEYIESILEHLRLESAVNFVIASRIAFYSSKKLKKILYENLNVHEDKIEQFYVKVNQGLEKSAVTEANLAIANARSLSSALTIARKKIGHFNTSEMLEIRHPLLSTQPKSLLSYTSDIFKYRKEYITKHNEQKTERLKTQTAIAKKLRKNKIQEFNLVVENTQKYMALRETIKYNFIKEYALIKKALDLLEKRLFLNKGDIFFIYPQELKSIIKNKKKFVNLISKRINEYQNNKLINIPAVITEKNIDSIMFNTFSKQNESLIIAGQLLAEGSKVENGIIVNINECGSIEEARKRILTYVELKLKVIVVVKQINLSHDPLIFYSSGIVIENANFVSHGAQRARELGKGAIGGIKSASLKSGTIIDFDPNNRIINIKQVKSILNENEKKIENILSRN